MKKLKLTTEEFIRKANEIHNNKYNYLEIQYKNNSTKISIICKLHGIFDQRPKDHLKGQGCPTCGKIKQQSQRASSSEEFIRKATTIHGNTYSYNYVKYINAHTKITIVCNECQHKFQQTPNSHLNGSGCPTCNTGGGVGFYVNKNNDTPAKVYIIRLYDEKEEFFKIGIAKETRTKIRFHELRKIYNVDILKTISMPLREAFVYEQKILNEYKSKKYTPLKHFEGWTECFSILPKILWLQLF